MRIRRKVEAQTRPEGFIEATPWNGPRQMKPVVKPTLHPPGPAFALSGGGGTIVSREQKKYPCRNKGA